MSIGMLSLVSPLHTDEIINRNLGDFVENLQNLLGEPIIHVSPENTGDFDLTIIFVKTGGVEGRFKEIFTSIKEPYILLATGFHNSLAASIEILTFIQQRGLRGEIIHGDTRIVTERILTLSKIARALRIMKETRLGIIGKPSDWLISGVIDPWKIKKTLGIELVHISMEEFMNEIGKHHPKAFPFKEAIMDSGFDPAQIEKALLNYAALEYIVEKYGLIGLTLRCFDMLEMARSTGCLALSLLNSEGIVAGCEGDVPSLLSMVIMNYLTAEPVFMANPSRIDVKNGTVLFSHCTIPLSMVSKWLPATHFESGIGMALQGTLDMERGTIFKVSSELDDFFVSGFDLIKHENESDLCRTQLMTRLDSDVRYFLKRPLGNHHLICRGDYSGLIREAMEHLGLCV